MNRVCVCANQNDGRNAKNKSVRKYYTTRETKKSEQECVAVESRSRRKMKEKNAVVSSSITSLYK